MVCCSALAALWIDPSQRAGLLPTEQTAKVVTHNRRVLASLLKQESNNGCLHQPILIPLGMLVDQHLHGAMRMLS